MWYNPTKKWLNRPQNVATAANKLKTFQQLSAHNVSVPDWTTDKTVAEQWISNGHKVFCRTTLTGHSGNGIIISTTVDELVDAPLYTKSVNKDKEYRVHVFNNKVIDYQQKKRKLNYDGPSTSGIRNHSNGWIYARNDIVLDERISTQALAAVSALGLDFGAVDICLSNSGNVFVFEVNTAPGLEGTTLTKYTEAVHEMLLLR